MSSRSSSPSPSRGHRRRRHSRSRSRSPPPIDHSHHEHAQHNRDLFDVVEFQRRWEDNKLFRGHQAYIEAKAHQMVVIAGTAMAEYIQTALVWVRDRESEDREKLHVLQSTGKYGTAFRVKQHEGENKGGEQTLVIGPFNRDTLIAFDFEHNRYGKAGTNMMSTMKRQGFEADHQFKRKGLGYVETFWFGIEDGGSNEPEFRDAILSVTLISNYKREGEHHHHK